MPQSPKFLNRYTSLPIALDVLTNKHITLLSPNTWEDRNDAYYLERYREQKKLGSVLAICFSTQSETFHHWRVFSSGMSGVCIEFNPERLLASIHGKNNFKSGYVNYSLVGNVKKTRPQVEEWPFLKRKPYQDEAEYRILYESHTPNDQLLNVSINLAAIQKITFSPWMPLPIMRSLAKIIMNFDECRDIDVRRSNLLDTAGWKHAID